MESGVSSVVDILRFWCVRGLKIVCFSFFFLLFFGNLTSFVSEKILHNSLRYILGFVEWYYMILLQDI